MFNISLLYFMLFTQFFFMGLGSFLIVKKVNLKIIIFISSLSTIFIACYNYLNLLTTGLLWIVYFSILTLVLKKEHLHSLYSVSMSIILFIFSDYLLLFFPFDYIDSNGLLRFISNLLIYSALLIFVVTRVDFSNYDHTNKLSISLIACATFGIYFIMISVERFATNYHTMELTNKFFVCFYGLGSLVISAFTIYSIKKNYQSRENKRQLEYLEYHAKEIENRYQELRSFKHDYKNVLLSMQSYIDSKDFDGLRTYFENDVMNHKSEIFENTFELANIQLVKVNSLKSILISKLSAASENGVKTSFLIFDELSYVPINEIEIVRILGIVLDNAIEATIPYKKQAFVECAILRESTEVKIFLSNSIHEELPPLHVLKERGVSTKGKNRGLGLRNLDELVGKNELLSLETILKNDTFCQIISIKERGI